MAFFQDISAFLSQTGQYCGVDKTMFAATTITTITTTRCLAVTGMTDEMKQVLNFTRVFDFTIYLPSSLSTIIKQNDQVSSVIDANGRTVVAAGKIEELREFTHWTEGLIYYVAGVTRVAS